MVILELFLDFVQVRLPGRSPSPTSERTPLLTFRSRACTFVGLSSCLRVWKSGLRPVSRFSWSTRTTEHPSHLKTPSPRHPGRTQPNGNIGQGDQCDSRRVQTFNSIATDATPIDQNVFASGSANPYQTPRSYATYRDPYTPDLTPPPFPAELSNFHDRPIFRPPASQVPIVDRIRPLPRREHDLDLQPNAPSSPLLPEASAEHASHGFRPADRAKGLQPMKRKPAPPSILSRDLGPSPPVSPPQSPPSVSKELP